MRTADQSFGWYPLSSRLSGAIETYSGDFAASNEYAWHTGTSGGSHSFADAGDGLERRISTFRKLRTWPTSAGLTFTSADLTLTRVGAFADYTWAPFDRINITGGTGATAGGYLVTGKASDDAITLAATIGNTATTSIGAKMCQQDSWGDVQVRYPDMEAGSLVWDVRGKVTGNPAMTVRLWVTHTDGVTNQTSLGSFTVTSGGIASGTGDFALKLTLQPYAPTMGQDDASAWQLAMEYLVGNRADQTVVRTEQMVYGAVNLRRDLRYWISYKKGAASSATDWIPRSFNVAHVAPRVGG